MVLLNISMLVAQAESEYDGADFEFIKQALAPIKTTLAAHMTEALNRQITHEELSQIRLEMVPTWGYVNIHLKHVSQGAVKNYVLSANPNCTIVSHMLVSNAIGMEDSLVKLLTL